MCFKNFMLIFVLVLLALFLPNVSDAAPWEPVTAKVLQVLNYSGFTYLEVQEKSGRKTWVAVAETKVNVKDTVEYSETPPQRNFTSKPLNRTFSEISFIPGIRVVSSAEPNIAAELAKIGRNDASCEKSMRLVKKKFGKPDEFIQLSPNTMTTIYRTKRLHFTYEIVGKTCTVTNSEF